MCESVRSSQFSVLSSQLPIYMWSVEYAKTQLWEKLKLLQINYLTVELVQMNSSCESWLLWNVCGSAKKYITMSAAYFYIFLLILTRFGHPNLVFLESNCNEV